MSIRIGLITDIHNGPGKATPFESVSLPLVDRFVDEMTTRFAPDVIVDMGDRINDRDPAADAEHITQVVERLRSSGLPTLFLHGNHDVVNLGNEAVGRLLGRAADYESVHRAGFHLVLLNTQDPTSAGGGGELSRPQLAWLERDLRHCDEPVIVFSHHPLDEQDSSSHWYFPTHPGCDLAVNRGEARKLLAASRRVRAAFSGHMHWNHTSVFDGVPYVTVGSLVERRLAGGRPAGSFAEVTADDRRITVTVRGALPLTFTYPAD